MSALGFDNYVDPLRIYLQVYREQIKGDKIHLKKKEEEEEESL